MVVATAVTGSRQPDGRRPGARSRACIKGSCHFRALNPLPDGCISRNAHASPSGCGYNQRGSLWPLAPRARGPSEPIGWKRVPQAVAKHGDKLRTKFRNHFVERFTGVFPHLRGGEVCANQSQRSPECSCKKQRNAKTLSCPRRKEARSETQSQFSSRTHRFLHLISALLIH